MDDYLKLNLIIIILFIIVIISYINEINNTKNSKIADIVVLIIRFIHYFVAGILIAYAFVFDEKYDYYYLIFLSFLIIKWLYLQDCILTYLEKKYYHNDVELCDLKYNNYYKYYLFFEYEQIFFIILTFFGLISFGIVIYRLKMPYSVKENIILYIIYIIYKLKGFFLNKYLL
jgi:hypothetical protein